jgi:uncharacterized protein with ParB-like and HNH nuclease domain
MEDIAKLEKRLFDDDDFAETPPSDIVAYNELRSCADLYRMCKQDVLDIQPDFQRNVVWTNPSRTRFIDSLIKQLPIPSMCFSLDYKTQRWQVIDGLQRISTIIAFLGDENWTLSKLDDIDQSISGQPVRNFRLRDNILSKYYDRVQNLTLPITVIRCDQSKISHNNYLFTIFHRLNTGGMKLNNQEIRNCIFSGSFNQLLRKLSKDKVWIDVNKHRGTRNTRMQFEELALRFFALSDGFESYGGQLARFLNDYMSQYRNVSDDWLKQKEEMFNLTTKAARLALNYKPMQRVTVSLLEALLVGISRSQWAMHAEASSLQAKFVQLSQHAELSDGSLREGLSHAPRVKARLNASVSIFAQA